ncbi:unnamed protein product, partial [Mesorhabditis belari]
LIFFFTSIQAVNYGKRENPARTILRARRVPIHHPGSSDRVKRG